MAVQVNLTGNNATDGVDIRTPCSVLQTSDNQVIIVTYNANNANNQAGYGNQSNVGTFEVWLSPDRGTFTRVASFGAAPEAVRITGFPVIVFSADLYSDNSVGIVYSTQLGVRYRKVTFGTWVVGAQQSVGNVGSTVTTIGLDMSISQTDNVLVAAMQTSPGNGSWYRMFCQKLSTPTAWSLPIDSDNLITGSAPVNEASCISVAWANGLLTGGRRSFCLVFGTANTTFDRGYTAYVDSVLESAATITVAGRVALFVDQGAGDLSPTETSNKWRRTCSVASTSETNTFQIGMMSIFPDPVIRVTKYQNPNGSATGVWNAVTPMTVRNGSTNASRNISTPAIVQGNNWLNFFASLDPALGATIPTNWVANIDPTDDTCFISGICRFTNEQTGSQDSLTMFGGGGRNAQFAQRSDMTYLRSAVAGSAVGTVLYYHCARSVSTVTAESPAAGTTMSDSTPAVSATATFSVKFPPSYYKARWEFATDSAFTTNLRVFDQDQTLYINAEGADVPGVNIRITDTLPSSLELSSGNWYLRSRFVDQFGQLNAPFTPTQTFSVAHPPTASSLSPTGGKVIVYNNGQVQFSWVFNDASPTDSQSAYQVLVRNNTTNAVLYDSGIVPSSSTTHTGIVPPAGKDANIGWAVRLRDKDNVFGAYSAYQNFQLVDGPSVTITSPTNGQVINAGVPSVTFTATVGGSRTITKRQIVWYKSGKAVYDTGIENVNYTSGQSVSYRGTQNVFDNNTTYSVQVLLTDSLGLQGRSAIVPFSTLFTVPPAVTGVAVTTGAFNNETTGGYVSVTWTDSGRDLNDFDSWVIYRRDNIIDPNTKAVIQSGVFKKVASVYAIAPTYEYRDYYAPSSYKVEYQVRQQVDRFGDLVMSTNNTTVSIFPQSDGYWLIQPNANDPTAPNAIRLSIVTSDDYTNEYEEEEYTVIGRGRHVDRGDRLGYTGTITAQLRDNEGVSARQKRVRLEAVKDAQIELYLRNPFGDIFKVHVGNMDISRVAGVGPSEYVDVSIPYSEVYE